MRNFVKLPRFFRLFSLQIFQFCFEIEHFSVLCVLSTRTCSTWFCHDLRRLNDETGILPNVEPRVQDDPAFSDLFRSASRPRLRRERRSFPVIRDASCVLTRTCLRGFAVSVKPLELGARGEEVPLHNVLRPLQAACRRGEGRRRMSLRERSAGVTPTTVRRPPHTRETPTACSCTYVPTNCAQPQCFMSTDD